ncbi:ORC-CDC6 family AAA ATPase [Cellulomonas soli]|uniref:Protein kinase domain-containing protein n=1 Tax=Cellulomonas soli TaxID=931535 RepID=A0A512PAM8_9CELL|nr:hypothetical protein [Cellulomonas soli]NYI60755.1 hypothetical protein [Cellulomonas soli]GEP68271.1 hypothetical protein CSO01_09860 [Cellulomonas soli]
MTGAFAETAITDQAPEQPGPRRLAMTSRAPVPQIRRQISPRAKARSDTVLAPWERWEVGLNHSNFVLNGRTLTVSAELRHIMSERLPTIGLATPAKVPAKSLHVSSDEYGRQCALTVFTGHDAPTTAELRGAARVAALVEGQGFASLVDVGSGYWEDSTDPSMAWVERWVRGLPLDTILTKRADEFSCTHLQRLMVDLAESMNALRAIGAVHGAMSSRNIILFRPQSNSLHPESYFTVVDLANARVLSEDEFADGRADAIRVEEDRAVLEILAHAHNTLIRNAELSRSQQGWLWQLGDFLVAASQDLESMAPIEPSTLLELAQNRSHAHGVSPSESSQLGDPFDYISAEHIASDELLYRIFADSCPWIDEVARPDPNLITGPRGCGKSMILRWLSIKTQLAGDPTGARLDALQVGAFYVSCTAEIQSQVAVFDSRAVALAAESKLIHYLNLVVAREVVATLQQMKVASRPEWGIDGRFSAFVFEFIREELAPGVVPIAGIDSLTQAYDIVAAQLRVAQEYLRGGRPPTRVTTPDFLNAMSSLLARETTFFAQHRVTFCLDDYSTHRVPEPVQQVLNRVIFGLRSANYIFKISAENRGFYPYDRANARIDVEREMKSINFGAAFVSLGSSESSGKALKFSSDLLANRLRAAGWKGTPQELLGATSKSNAQFAREASAAARDEGPRPMYAGLPCISDLCSGDMSTLLLVYRRIFDLGDVNRDSSALVAERVQNDAIRLISREMLQAIRTHEPHGQRMLTIAQEFCRLARFALEHGTVVEHGEAVPMKRTRIEIDGLSLPELELGNAAEGSVVKELIRRAIFIDLGPGDSRHAERVTTRLMMRRIYLPAFQLSLAKNGQFAWPEKQFLRFLQDPAGVRVAEQRKITRPQAHVDALFDDESLSGGDV